MNDDFWYGTIMLGCLCFVLGFSICMTFFSYTEDNNEYMSLNDAFVINEEVIENEEKYITEEECTRNFEEIKERYGLLYDLIELTPRVRLQGVYYHNKFYCVWVENRSNEAINRTECHELCHHFVYNDKKHFCGNGTE